MSPHPRLSLNQATIRFASLREAVSIASATGYSSIGLWRESILEIGIPEAVNVVADSGLRVSSLCRGGFLTAITPSDRVSALDDNRRAIDEARAIGAPTLVLVAGGLPNESQDLVGARSRFTDAVGQLADHAKDAGVTLAIEPLHPMYASDRSVISTLEQALDIAEQYPSKVVGVVVDTFHVWWDPKVFDGIARAGATGRIASYQVCDWATPLTEDVLLSRHYPGDGVINFRLLTSAVIAAGYEGDVEVEIFNRAVWESDWDEVANLVCSTFAAHVAEYLQ
jgi:sugar phosphate isomerase/epimerase